MKRFLSFLLPLLIFQVTVAQSDPRNAVDPTPFAEMIQPDPMRTHLEILASDEFEGRETGTKGQKMAADYIANYFKKLGIPPLEDGTYFQKIAFSSEKWNAAKLDVNNRKFNHLYDFYAYPGKNTPLPAFETKEVVFLGYGIEDSKYNDFKKEKVKGKVVLIYSGEPMKKDSTFWISGNSEPSEWSSDVNLKLAAAKKHGVKLVLIIDPDIQKSIAENRNKIVGGNNRPVSPNHEFQSFANSIFISPTVARQIIGDKIDKIAQAREAIQAHGKPRKLALKTLLKAELDKSQNSLEGENVLGYLEGIDPNLKHELVVVTAHYDHLGKKGESVFNGADDNGSGTTTVLEVCRAFVEAKKQGKGPRRSVLFMLVSGEEKGLLGSKYYVQHPIFPLESTIVNVNVDMVGRVDEKHKDNPNYIYVIGADKLSSELHSINETMNAAHTKLDLDYTYNDPADPNRFYYRSDHYNFAERDIPAIFYFNGTHDDYHRPTDDVEKINFEKMAKIGQLIFLTSWELASRNERIKVDVKP